MLTRENTNLCVIEQLINKPFLDRPKDEQDEIIKTGRPTPIMPNLTKKYHNTNRHFNNRHYVRYEWLTGSIKLNKLFCWYCLLFEDRKKDKCKYLWASVGYSDMRQLVMAATRHALSQNHHKHMIEYHKFQDRFNIPVPKQSNIIKKTSVHKCTINQILGSPFLDRSMKEQLEIYHNGRPTPPMPLLFNYDLKTNTKVGFQTENYIKYKWMAGSQKLNRLYCWSCLLFADPSLNEEWISIGFNKMDAFEKSVHDITIDNFLSTEIHEKHLECDSDDDFESFIDNVSINPNIIDSNNVQDYLNKYECIIQQIVTNNFVNFSEDLQKQILANGRPTPDTSQFSKLGDTFFNKYSWLTASIQTFKYYCWHCLLMKEPYDTNFWGEEGIPYAKNLPNRIEKHTKSNIHIICTSKYIELLTKFEITVGSLTKNQSVNDDDEENSFLEKYKDSNCIVIQLLRHKFESRTNDEQKTIIKNGRPTPANLVRLECYQKYEWLCGSQILNKLFCWNCLLFGKSTWGREGVSNNLKITDALKKHDNSMNHKHCLAKYQTLSNTRCLINELLGRPFCNRTLQSQIEIIKNGKLTPGMQGEQFIENFDTFNYVKYQWLTGSIKLCKLFCWPCLLFADPESTNVWIQTGFGQLQKLDLSACEHQISDIHKEMVKKLDTFKKMYCDNELLSVN
ncbi:uncharacterized protein LOC123293565 [Chrysoperla carnea]|uniref:uncharacterized protein LOC123293565 n=1 Tax=Chrysoperla carnea TaxID=189513 RepID=UPI001D08C5E0|nr:uncharacterized protein LOC123293565 [Chrysoperla carnea]